MTDLFDHRQVRRAFSRAAHGYDNAAALQREVAARLMEQLDYLDDPALNRAPPQVVLDVGCGPAHATVAMQKRWPKAQVIALDLALPMLHEARHNFGGWRPFTRRPDPVCADARALPLRDASQARTPMTQAATTAVAANDRSRWAVEKPHCANIGGCARTRAAR